MLIFRCDLIVKFQWHRKLHKQNEVVLHMFCRQLLGHFFLLRLGYQYLFISLINNIQKPFLNLNVFYQFSNLDCRTIVWIPLQKYVVHYTLEIKWTSSQVFSTVRKELAPDVCQLAFRPKLIGFKTRANLTEQKQELGEGRGKMSVSAMHSARNQFWYNKKY